MPRIVTTVAELRRAIAARKTSGRTRLGLVPTMGALHAGHIGLVSQARHAADQVVVSIFVNPAQFAPHEDFDAYPRRLEDDVKQLGDLADIVFAPAVGEIYPPGHATSIHVGGPALGLESDFRPHFFSGVATVVAKLLIAASPDMAVFGEKDYQQLLVVRQLVRDLSLPVEIMAAPTLREADGLALSSRNAYLTPQERQIAGRMNQILKQAIAMAKHGDLKAAETWAMETLRQAGFTEIDYVAIRDADSLAEIKSLERPARILAAAKVGRTRLIDNMALAPQARGS